MHFSINYNDEIRGFQKEIMPKNLFVSFKDDMVHFDISSGIGKSGICILNNPNKEIFDMYCTLLSYRYYYAADKDEILPGFGSMEGITFNKTDRTSIICGYECVCTEAVLPSNRDRIYEIWSTNEIHIKNPNQGTPFEPIDGVMLNFFFIIGGTEMHFSADNVYSKDLPNDLFQRKPTYVSVDKVSLDKFILKMINI